MTDESEARWPEFRFVEIDLLPEQAERLQAHLMRAIREAVRRAWEASE